MSRSIMRALTSKPEASTWRGTVPAAQPRSPSTSAYSPSLRPILSFWAGWTTVGVDEPAQKPQRISVGRAGADSVGTS